MEPIPPSPILLFWIMFAGVLGVLALIFFFAFLTRTAQRVKHGGLAAAFPAGVRQRSRPGYKPSNAVRRVRPQQNAEHGRRSGVQAFISSSETNANTGDTVAIVPLPITADELQKLAHSITLYARRPNKQLAIEAAWNCTKGDMEEWKRGSLLFDSAMGMAAMAVAKRKEKEPA